MTFSFGRDADITPTDPELIQKCLKIMRPLLVLNIRMVINVEGKCVL